MVLSLLSIRVSRPIRLFAPGAGCGQTHGYEPSTPCLRRRDGRGDLVSPPGPPGSVDAFLADHRQQLFPPERADPRGPARGRPHPDDQADPLVQRGAGRVHHPRLPDRRPGRHGQVPGGLHRADHQPGPGPALCATAGAARRGGAAPPPRLGARSRCIRTRTSCAPPVAARPRAASRKAIGAGGRWWNARWPGRSRAGTVTKLGATAFSRMPQRNSSSLK